MEKDGDQMDWSCKKMKYYIQSKREGISYVQYKKGRQTGVV